MKNQTLKWMIRAAFLTVFAMLFARCEMGLTETAPPADVMPFEGDLSAAVVAMRGQRPGAVEVCACLTGNFAYEDLSEAEKGALTFMREEEKLARDVYLELKERWNVPIFANIARSEQRHMDAVLCLIEKYELTDPVGDNGLGVFQNADLQTLYNKLTEKGAQSLEDALIVGATIEDLDIFDLKQNINQSDVDNDDVLAVFNELMKGSRNHLRAFTGLLENSDATYERQYLSQEDFEKIIGTDWERGGSICGVCPNPGAGFGNGPNGKGNGQGGGGRGQGNCNGSGPNGFGNGPNGNPGGNCILTNNGNSNRKGSSPNNGNRRNRRGN